MASTVGLELTPAPEGLEVAEGVAADQDDVTAAAAVATVGSAFGDVGLPSEAHAAVAAATGVNVDLGVVVEHVGCRSSARGG